MKTALSLLLLSILPLPATAFPLQVSFDIGGKEGYWTLDSNNFPESMQNPNFTWSWWRFPSDPIFRMEWDGVAWTEENSTTDGFEVIEVQNQMWISFWSWEGFDPVTGKSFTLYGKNLNGYEVGELELVEGPLESPTRTFGSWALSTPVEVSEPPVGALVAVGAALVLGMRRRLGT